LDGSKVQVGIKILENGIKNHDKYTLISCP